MTDLFSEIEQDLRREQAAKLWGKYGIYLIGLAVGVVLIASAIVGWRAWQNSNAETASKKYDAVIAAAKDQKPEEAVAALTAFADTTTTGYAALARMEEAGYLVKAGDTKGAVAAFDKVANNTALTPILRGMAQIKAGLLLVDTATYDEMNARLASVDESGNAWRNNARELLGLSAYKAGKYDEAEANYAAIIADRNTSAGLRDRAHVMQALIAPHLQRPEDKATVVTPDAKAAAPASAPVSTSNNDAPAQAAPDAKAE